MALFGALTLLVLLSIAHHVHSATSDVGLNPVQIIENHGYTAETHYITTEDGYILTYHRIPYGLDGNADRSRPPVLLMHGFFSSSADYVNMGTNRSLGFLLADSGYDVWIANSRGNAWARNHTFLDVTSDPEHFFDFSWHEMGYYDLPAAIDHILEVNGADALQYVGHSQGCADFLVLATTRPEYNVKIKLASLMAPPSAMENREKVDVVTVLAKYIDQIGALFKKYQIYEVPYTEAIREWFRTSCANVEMYDVCKALLSIYGGGADDGQVDEELLPVIGTNAPSNSAIKQIIHFGQQIKNGGFSLFDYGVEKNVEIYGSETPPTYDFSKIIAPIAIYYGKNDNLVLAKNIQALISKLPNVVNDYLVPYDYFNHIDFIFAKDVVEFLYEELISVMLKY